MNEDYVSRFSFEITEEQKKRADHLLRQYGLRRAIFSTLLDEVLDIIERNGPVAVGVLISKAVSPKEIIPTLHRANTLTKGGRSDGESG